jgi:hypothetical protein
LHSEIAVTIKWEEDPAGYLVYTNTRTGRRARVWGDTVAEIAFACQEWHGGKGSACYRMISGDYSFELLSRALDELRDAFDHADADDQTDEDAYFDLAEAIEDLEGVIGRIAKVVD